MNEIITLFTCSDLPAPVSAEVEAATMRIKDRLTRQVEDIIETGRDLLEVKSKLQHGQFEPWLSQEFGMTDRTARRFMQAATWAEGKSDTVSVLTPTTVYLLSAKSTPDVVHEQIVERIEKGMPAEPEMVRHLIKEAKSIERQAENRKGRRKARAAREHRETRWERERRKREEEHQRKQAAAMVIARQVAGILFNKLNEDEINKVCAALENLDVIKTMLREAITYTRLPPSDNVFPIKPWESKS